MKTHPNELMLAAALSLLLYSTTFAAPPSPENSIVPRFTPAKLDLIERNLVIALTSNSPSLQTSAALVMRQVKNLNPAYDFSRSVIPLLAIVKNDEQPDEARIAAALILHDLRSGIGDFAISRVALFTDNARLKHICEALTVDRIKESEAAQK